MSELICREMFNKEINQMVKEGFVLNLFDIINHRVLVGRFIECYLKYNNDKELLLLNFHVVRVLDKACISFFPHVDV